MQGHGGPVRPGSAVGFFGYGRSQIHIWQTASPLHISTNRTCSFTSETVASCAVVMSVMLSCGRMLARSECLALSSFVPQICRAALNANISSCAAGAPPSPAHSPLPRCAVLHALTIIGRYVRRLRKQTSAGTQSPIENCLQDQRRADTAAGARCKRPGADSRGNGAWH